MLMISSYFSAVHTMPPTAKPGWLTTQYKTSECLRFTSTTRLALYCSLFIRWHDISHQSEKLQIAVSYTLESGVLWQQDPQHWRPTCRSGYNRIANFISTNVVEFLPPKILTFGLDKPVSSLSEMQKLSWISMLLVTVNISNYISTNEVEFPLPKSSLLVLIKPILTI